MKTELWAKPTPWRDAFAFRWYKMKTGLTRRSLPKPR